MSVGIAIATFGDREYWGTLAQRALASAARQTTPAELVMWSHGDTLHETRNNLARELGTDWLIFLDADDELDPRYIEAMTAAAERTGADVIKPATIGILPDGTTDGEPVLITPKPLDEGNHIVVGAMVRASLFHEVGGFRDLPMYEDWDLWLRIQEAGGEFTATSGAVYRVHLRPDSRNNQPHKTQVATYHRIRRDALERRREPCRRATPTASPR